jgi:hypothetical protein
MEDDMKVSYQSTDATAIYRETSGLTAIRMDRTGNTGSLIEIMRDTVLVLGPPMRDTDREKILENPRGTIDAYSQT